MKNDTTQTTQKKKKKKLITNRTFEHSKQYIYIYIKSW